MKFCGSATDLQASSALSGGVYGLAVIKVLAPTHTPSPNTHKGSSSALVQITSVPVIGAFCPHHLRAYSCSCDRQ